MRDSEAYACLFGELRLIVAAAATTVAIAFLWWNAGRQEHLDPKEGDWPW